MNRKAGVCASVVIVLLVAAVAAWAWPQIPADKAIPVHWSATGVPNGYASKFWALIGLPLLTAAAAVVLAMVPSLEPRARNLAMSGKAYLGVWITVLVVVALAFVAMVLSATGYPVRISVIVPIILGAVLVVVGNYVPKTRSNFFFGVRTPWTLSSELTWSKTHRLAGRLFVLCGLIVVAASLLAPGATAAWVLTIAIVLAITIPVLYSYLVWRAELDRR